MRQLSPLDRFLHEAQHFLDTLSHTTQAHRANPASNEAETELSPDEQCISQGCMRVNHTGEICAQALYRGQAFGTKNQPLKQHLNKAALEEIDHLHWCKERLDELDTHMSYLTPFWYCASFLIGYTAARRGDPLSLGFVEETEQQVLVHLTQHQKILPVHDQKSRAIIGIMKLDEAEHADNARNAGAKRLSPLLKLLMKLQSKVMTTTAYHI